MKAPARSTRRHGIGPDDQVLPMLNGPSSEDVKAYHRRCGLAAIEAAESVRDLPIGARYAVAYSRAALSVSDGVPFGTDDCGESIRLHAIRDFLTVGAGMSPPEYLLPLDDRSTDSDIADDIARQLRRAARPDRDNPSRPRLAQGKVA